MSTISELQTLLLTGVVTSRDNPETMSKRMEDLLLYQDALGLTHHELATVWDKMKKWYGNQGTVMSATIMDKFVVDVDSDDYQWSQQYRELLNSYPVDDGDFGFNDRGIKTNQFARVSTDYFD